MSRKEVICYNLLALLTGEHARMSFENVVQGFPMDKINDNFPNADSTPWHLLEHTRLAQADILDFIRNPNYKEKEWPRDYWPERGKKATPADWKRTIRDFKRDFEELQNLVKNPKTDLYSDIPWGAGETILREIVAVSNHNAFHLGEFAMMRQAMGTWGTSHKA